METNFLQKAQSKIKEIGTPRSKNDPNFGIKAVAKTLLKANGELSTQIIASVSDKRLLIAQKIGLRIS